MISRWWDCRWRYRSGGRHGGEKWRMLWQWAERGSHCCCQRDTQHGRRQASPRPCFYFHLFLSLSLSTSLSRFSMYEVSLVFKTNFGTILLLSTKAIILMFLNSQILIRCVRSKSQSPAIFSLGFSKKQNQNSWCLVCFTQNTFKVWIMSETRLDLRTGTENKHDCFFKKMQIKEVKT